MSTPTELWFRQPQLYIRELVECDVENYTFDMGTLARLRNDPFKFFDLNVPAHQNWRLLVMDDQKRMCTEYDKAHGTEPVGVHPMWTMDMPRQVLEIYMRMHKRVIFLNRPMLMENPNEYGERQEISDLQLEYPDCKLHIKGAYSFRVMFGMNFGAADFDPRTDAAHGKVFLTQGGLGIVSNPEHWERIKYSAKLLGIDPNMLPIPRNRCLFNIQAGQWAAKYYKDREISPAIRRSANQQVDIENAEFERLKIQTARVRMPRDLEKRQQAEDNGDFFLCNACSLQTKCDFFRFGAVCAVPGSEPTELAKFFGSHDAETIKHGLSNLLMFESNRVIQAAEAEAEKGEIDPELTKMINTLFDRGVKMVKLLDPSARGGINIHMPGSHQSQVNIANADPKQVLGAIVAELESRGIDRQDITKEMLMGILSQDDRHKAIEGAVISSKTEVA